jgi:hypothetical protein
MDGHNKPPSDPRRDEIWGETWCVEERKGGRVGKEEG